MNLLEFEDVFEDEELDFEEIAATLPFPSINDLDEIEVIELDENGNVVDVIDASPDNLENISNYYDIYPLGQIGARVSGKFSVPSYRTSFTLGKPKPKASKPSVLKPRASKTTIRGAIGRAFGITRPIKAIRKARKTTASKIKTAIKKPKKTILKATVRPQTIQEKAAIRKVKYPDKVKPSLSTVAYPCPSMAALPAPKGLGRIESILQKQAVQTQATYEHNLINSKNKFRNEVLNRLVLIDKKLPNLSNNMKIRIACGLP